MNLRKDLEKENYSETDLNKGQIFTAKLYKKGFQMDNLLQNEESQDFLNQLEVSEKNLSNNLSNKDLVKNFLNTAKSVQKSLKQKYNDLWVSPQERQMMG